MLAQLRRSREQEVARAKAMARADAARRPGDPGGTGITTGRNQVVAASLAVQGYIDSRGTVKGKLGKDFTRAVVPGKEDFPQWWLDGKIPPEKDSRTSRVNKAVEQKKQQEKSNDRFEKFISETLGHEGGYVNDPADRGGRTNWGISWKIWVATAKKYLNMEPTPENLKNLTVLDAKKIYKGEYWNTIGAEKIKDPNVAYMIFDWNINSHETKAKIQSMLNEKYKAGLKVDGAFGPKTIQAINNIEDQHQLVLNIAEIRKKHYEGIIKKHPDQARFEKGWMNRIDKCLNKIFLNTFTTKTNIQ